MNWLKKLFAGEPSKPLNKDTQPVKKERDLFFTNSANFPVGPIELKNTGLLRIDAILGMAAFSDYAKANNFEIKQEVLYTILTEDGAVTIPLYNEVDGQKYAVFFIYTEEELGKYQSLEKEFDKLGCDHLIYFSAIPITKSVPEKKVFEPLQLADLRFDKDIPVSGEYAIWWASDGDLVFHESPTFRHLSMLNEIFGKYATFLHGYVLRQTRIVEEEQIRRQLLPDTAEKYGLKGPNGIDIILEISANLGIRFYFPQPDTDRAYREKFLSSVLADFLYNYAEIKHHNFDPDLAEHVPFSEMIKQDLEMIKEKELKGDQVNKYGVLDDHISDIVQSGTTVPSWTNFTNRNDFLFFLKTVKEYFTSENIQVQISNGIAKVVDGEMKGQNYGLQNLAQLCTGLEREEYMGQISVHFNQMFEAFRNQEAFDKNKDNFDFASEFVAVRIHHESFAKMVNNPEAVTKKLAGDIYAILSYDLPTTIVSLSDTDLITWGKSFQEIYDLGIDNIFEKLDFPITEVNVGGVDLLVSESLHFYVPNTLLDLHNRPDLVGQYGSLVAVPTRNLIFIYRIESMEVIKAISILIRITIDAHQKGPGQISDNILWYRDQTFEKFDYDFEEEKISIKPSDEFIKVLEEIGKEGAD